MISVLGVLSSRSTDDIGRDVFYQVFEMWVEAQTNVLGWRYKLGIHQNKGSISSPAQRKPEEHHHSNNEQKKKRIPVGDLKYPQRIFTICKKCEIAPLVFHITSTHRKTSKYYIHSLSRAFCVHFFPI